MKNIYLHFSAIKWIATETLEWQEKFSHRQIYQITFGMNFYYKYIYMPNQVSVPHLFLLSLTCFEGILSVAEYNSWGQRQKGQMKERFPCFSGNLSKMFPGPACLPACAHSEHRRCTLRAQEVLRLEGAASPLPHRATLPAQSESPSRRNGAGWSRHHH